MKFEFNELTHEELNHKDSGSFKDIKPERLTSLCEVTDYWANTFKDLGSENDADLYKRLISEVYGCSEDDIRMDFEINDDIYQELKGFKDKIWGDLTDEERFTRLNEMVKKVGAMLGLKNIPTAEIIWDGAECFGFYDEQSNTIKLNGVYLDDAKEILDTLLHELRHAYQHYRAEVGESWEDKLFQFNFDNYIEPKLGPFGWVNFTEYQNQYIEVDARAFANIFIEALKNE